MDAGTIGGIIGGAIGFIGGIVGCYFSIKNTKGPRERAFMVRVSVIAFIVVIAFLAGLMLLPRPYNFLMWIPYGIALPLGIRWCNRRQMQIRTEEAQSRA
jgi:Ca2+/Na+ antiporter